MWKSITVLHRQYRGAAAEVIILWSSFHYLPFLSRVSILTRDIDIAILSVRRVPVFYLNDLGLGFGGRF